MTPNKRRDSTGASHPIGAASGNREEPRASSTIGRERNRCGGGRGGDGGGKSEGRNSAGGDGMMPATTVTMTADFDAGVSSDHLFQVLLREAFGVSSDQACGQLQAADPASPAMLLLSFRPINPSSRLLVPSSPRLCLTAHRHPTIKPGVFEGGRRIDLVGGIM